MTGSERSSEASDSSVPVRTPRAGRDLPAAIITGAALLIPAVLGIILLPLLLIMVAVVLLCMGAWEVARALETQGLRLPKLPLYLGAAAMPLAAYFGGVEALTLGLIVTCIAIAVAAALLRVEDPGRSIMASMFVACWVPFLISFAVLVIILPQGQWRLAVVVLLVVSNDTFGYIVGILFGRHPMAPKISPKKSWEGFAGSMVGSILVGVLTSWLVFSEPLYVGAVLAAAVVVAATAGDFSESMVKRELGVKDMSQVLPGHGGVMDRLDSLVFAMPTAYFVIVALTRDSGGVPLG